LKVPGLNVQESSTGGFTPHLRGVGLSSINAGQENSIATYVDGVYIANPGATLLQLNNISQVEVYKGPQGTLFGRNATGGLINIKTRMPSEALSLDVSAGYGNYGTEKGTLYATGGLTDKLAADIAVMVTNQSEGFGKNLFTGRDVYKTNDLG